LISIHFHLDGVPAARAGKAFKQAAARELFLGYLARISKFTACSASGSLTPKILKEAGAEVWVCDGRSGKVLSSEALAAVIRELRDSGTRVLRIILGGPDGFSRGELSRMNPDFIWSFGPMTLPHELAAAVAAEQVYRAFTILEDLPYHTGH